MNIADLEVRLTKQIVDNKPAGLTSFNFPRRDMVKTLPRVDVDFFGLGGEAVAISGVNERLAGGIQMTVCTDMDQTRAIGTKEANAFADAVKAIFTYGEFLTFTGGAAHIVRMPSIRSGFQNPDNEDEWCVPVVVNFEATNAA